MKLSSKTHYGLLACTILACKHPETVSATELERGIGVSNKYIEQIMRKLSSREITYANRGVSGGYGLVNSPEQTIVGEIVRALEDDMEIIECVVGKGTCKCCPSKSVWNKLYRGINEILDEITLKQMIEGDVK